MSRSYLFTLFALCVASSALAIDPVLEPVLSGQPIEVVNIEPLPIDDLAVQTGVGDDTVLDAQDSPEPTTMLIFGTGLAALAVYRRQRKVA